MVYYFQCFNCTKVLPLEKAKVLKCASCGSDQGQRRTHNEYENFSRLGWFSTPLSRRKPLNE